MEATHSLTINEGVHTAYQKGDGCRGTLKVLPPMELEGHHQREEGEAAGTGTIHEP